MYIRLADWLERDSYTRLRILLKSILFHLANTGTAARHQTISYIAEFGAGEGAAEPPS